MIFEQPNIYGLPRFEEDLRQLEVRLPQPQHQEVPDLRSQELEGQQPRLPLDAWPTQNIRKRVLFGVFKPHRKPGNEVAAGGTSNTGAAAGGQR